MSVGLRLGPFWALLHVSCARPELLTVRLDATSPTMMQILPEAVSVAVCQGMGYVLVGWKAGAWPLNRGKVETPFKG